MVEDSRDEVGHCIRCGGLSPGPRRRLCEICVADLTFLGGPARLHTTPAPAPEPDPEPERPVPDWDWAGIEQRQRQARVRGAGLRICRLCGKPLWGGQYGSHKICAEGGGVARGWGFSGG